MTSEAATVIIPFPFANSDPAENSKRQEFGDYSVNPQAEFKWTMHPAIANLRRVFDLESSCGYITMMSVRGSSTCSVIRASHSDTNLAGVIKLEDVPEDSGTDEDDQIIFVSSKSSPLPEPKNGFNDDKCAKIYKDELDSVINEDLTKDASNVMKPQVYDSRQQKIESLRLDLTVTRPDTVGGSGCLGTVLIEETAEDKLWYEDWTLLDCHFGIPLFDASVNQTISERIVSNKLWDEGRSVKKNHFDILASV